LLFSQLRSLPFLDNIPLGGVQGEDCKDARRGLHVNPKPIMNIKQFEDFIFTRSKTASPLYTQFLRDILPPSWVQCVFIHGDVRPANIIVDMDDDGAWRVIAVIDWETSGFYSKYWESVKMTNNLMPRDYFDWYRYLLESLSPRRYSIQWLVDRLWDRNMINS
jgi:thiamine kinase-like enzyme